MGKDNSVSVRCSGVGVGEKREKSDERTSVRYKRMKRKGQGERIHGKEVEQGKIYGKEARRNVGTNI